MRTLNLGILAHVDAGKTTLTERLLHAAGVIDELGSVDDGTTQTDTLALERQRGITIKSAVVSFVLDDLTVNLIDTPGHPDFIAEVERVLGVLDGAVLVISAVEGVQAQTRLLMRTLQRLRIPTVILVNKIDRGGARYEQVLQDISERLTPAIVPMGTVRDLGTRVATFVPFGGDEPESVATLAPVLADRSDAILATFIADDSHVPYRWLRGELAAQTRRALVHPVFFGSAITGAGVDALTAAFGELLPAKVGDAESRASGMVFKIERGPAGEKIAYVRMFSGSVRIRERLRFGRDRGGKVTAISVFVCGSTTQRASIAAGQIGKLSGLDEIRIGDMIGTGRLAPERHQFPPPTLETVVVQGRGADKGLLHVALAQLAEQDPLINLRQDDAQQQLFVSLYGEVQKEVIRDTLASDYGIAVEFHDTTTICIERPLGAGAAAEFVRQGQNPFLATIGLRVEPAPEGSGVAFVRTREVLGVMPIAFFKAVEDTVHQTLRQGLRGWQVTDCIVTMTHAGYWGKHGLGHQPFSKSLSSTGADYRGLTPLVLMSALRQAGTVVCEPIHRFHLEVPADTLGAVSAALGELRAILRTQVMAGRTTTLEGEITATRMHGLQRQLRGLTRGEGVLELGFVRYEPVRGTRPSRPRSDHNPLNRKEYLLRVLRPSGGDAHAR